MDGSPRPDKSELTMTEFRFQMKKENDDPDSDPDLFKVQ